MGHTLDSFAKACRAAISADPGPGGRQKVCELVREVLKDPDFVAANIKADGSERHVLYEDPEHKFAILAHSYHGAKDSTPHDHGPTWAIYGQATGETIMTDWEKVAEPQGEEPGRVRRVRDYSLTPGMAYVYEPGVLHSPRRDASTTLLRIEGFNLGSYKRNKYVPV
jgi:predicted metal-dependent enzyme (double-stranded beta helix superfamily)